MKSIFIFLAVLAALTAGLFSEELPEDWNRINAVIVIGLKRTKRHVIEKPLRKFIGRDAGSVDTNEVFAVVQAAGILEPVSVEIQDNQDGNGKILMVTVLEKSLFKFKFGVISLLAAYQAVYSHSGLLPHQFDHGPVAMLQMYFSRVAMPGVGLGAAYNVDKNVWQYAINAGMTF
jgi:hypothetical protein